MKQKTTYRSKEIIASVNMLAPRVVNVTNPVTEHHAFPASHNCCILLIIIKGRMRTENIKLETVKLKTSLLLGVNKY